MWDENYTGGKFVILDIIEKNKSKTGEKQSTCPK